MKFHRLYSTSDCRVSEQVDWRTVDVCIKDVNDKIIFEQKGVRIPASWSDQAATILASKYFRKAGVPSITEHWSDNDCPNLPMWLMRSKPSVAFDNLYSGETSAHQVFHRLAGAWTYWGWREGLFNLDEYDEEENARVFYDEIYMMLAKQIAAPNSPQWFSTGLHWAYGIEGDANGQWTTNEYGAPYQTTNTYERPQPHACFLSSVTDDLVNPGGIMDLWVREARIFKHGSGSGTNVSNIRAKGEPLSGGGTASGVMSWLRIGDSAAGAIQSGGTTRRAAVMRCLDVDHPEIEEFVTWKQREEAKAAAMYVGSQIIHNSHIGNGSFTDLVITYPDAVVERSRQGIEPEIFDINYEGEAIKSVDGQNSNNSVWVTDDFLQRIDDGPGIGNWGLIERTTGKTCKVVSAHELWNKICLAAWACADPGVLFSDTGNAWNTCAFDGRIRTVNPCAEFWHLDGSACNLASLRLTAFLNEDYGQSY
jgi:ribonucleoside-diphosphate reductase alpha chain